MNIACASGLHKWDGCKCTACAKTRDRDHNWSKDCEKCETCGLIRTNTHDWRGNCEQCKSCGALRPNAHKWNGCKCSICRKTRDLQHDWTENCEQCKRCGGKRANVHKWVECRCEICGTTRDTCHHFVGLKCTKCGEQLKKLSLAPAQTCLILFYRDDGIRDISYLRMTAKMGSLMGHIERRDSHNDYWIVIGNCYKEMGLSAFEKAGCAGFWDSKQIAYAAVLSDSQPAQ